MTATSVCALLCLLVLSAGCVSKKRFSSELRLRRDCETREMVTATELEKRRKETRDAQEKVAQLNRSVGNLEKENNDLRAENKDLTARIRETTGSAESRQTELTSVLRFRDSILQERDSFLQVLKTIAVNRKGTLNGLLIEMNNQLPMLAHLIELKGTSLLLTLPDTMIFDKTGLKVSDSGLRKLAEIADFINRHPALQVVIEAHTDNSIPKSDLIRDSWDWSLIRAMAIVKAFAKELNVTTNQLTAAGKGEFYPVASNESREGREANRRTVLVFTTKLPEVYPLLDK